MDAERNSAGDYNSGGVTRRIPGELAGMRLDQALARMFPEHSRSRLQNWLREGRVLLEHRAAKPKQRIWGGEEIALHPPQAQEMTAAKPQRLPLEVVYEDDAVLVINKPAGLVVHPGVGHREGTLLNALLAYAPQLAALARAGIVHRLDKDTSGLLAVAKTPEAQTALVRQLQARSVRREYLALVHGVVSSGGEIAAPVGRHPRSRTRMAVVSGGKPALTRYRVLARYANATLLECSLATGRTHQIRVHLHALGHPLVGDPVYRSRAARLPAFSRQALHAAKLEFAHPQSGAPMRFEAPLPVDMRALLESLE